jgi:uncharacterized protein YjbI with pentapeptide repeats/serine/threonine protein kinase
MQLLTDRYEIVRPIGRGGVGEVYEGRQVALDRPVAIKVLRPELTQNAAAVARFEREARTTCRLHHPNVVTVFDVDVADDGHRFLIMELLEGMTLAERLRQEPPLTYDETLTIAQQIVRGMAAGQGVGLVHRDLKPENIFIVGDLHVKILDFGLATLMEGRDPSESTELGTPMAVEAVLDGGAVMLSSGDTLRGSDPNTTFDLSGSMHTPSIDLNATQEDIGFNDCRGDPVGTPRYMAPEQVLGWDVDHRSDLYSFGCILFEMLAGQSPFPGPTSSDFMRQHLHHPPGQLEDLAPNTPDEMIEIVDRLLRKSPTDRFADWVGMAESLRRLELGRIQPASQSLPWVAPPSKPTEPYRFLHPFTASFQSIFFGRDKDIRRFQDAWRHADRPSMVFLTGASGVGKTSFLAARVIPALEEMGIAVLRVRGGANPLHQLHMNVTRKMSRSDSNPSDTPLPQLIDMYSEEIARPIAIVLDQLEEVFTSGDEDAVQTLQAGVASVLAGGDDRVRLILSIREDYLGPLHRALHPLPVDEIARTVPLLPLKSEDLKAALEGPGEPSLSVDYPPFTFAPGLVDEIVADLLSDAAGEVAPRVQAVGARLWEMVRNTPDRHITSTHYRAGLGGAVGILARILDEAITDLPPGDRGLAKEVLRAITHLPGSATSRPTPESELVAYAADKDRRMAVLRRLENRWRVVQGYADPRWPDERTYRVAHEALITQIRQYGDDGTDRNRARQLFYQGFRLWLKGGMQAHDLLPEQHFDEVQQCVQDLVLRTVDERRFYQDCLQTHNEGWMRRHLEQRRRALKRRAQLTILPALLVALGVLLGQVPVDFISIRTLRIHILSAISVSRLDLSGEKLSGVDLSGLGLRHVDLSGTDLSDAKLVGADLRLAVLKGTVLERANLEGANLQQADLSGAVLNKATFRQADLRKAQVLTNTEDADFDGARFDGSTVWLQGQPPVGAFGPNGRARNVVATGSNLQGLDLKGMHMPFSTLSGSDLFDVHLDGANLEGADLSGSQLSEAKMTRTYLKDANLSHSWLVRAKFRKADLTGTDLRHTNLRSAEFQEALNLSTSQLTGAVADRRTRWPPGFDPVAAGVLLIVADAKLGAIDLSGRRLSGLEAPGIQLSDAVLTKADLRRANLNGADLRRADLREANLSGATLHSADLCGADLRDALLVDASFDDARVCEGTRFPSGILPDGLR